MDRQKSNGYVKQFLTVKVTADPIGGHQLELLDQASRRGIRRVSGRKGKWRGAGAWPATGTRGEGAVIDAITVDALVVVGERDGVETRRPDAHTVSEFSNPRGFGMASGSIFGFGTVNPQRLGRLSEPAGPVGRVRPSSDAGHP